MKTMQTTRHVRSDNGRAARCDRSSGLLRLAALLLGVGSAAGTFAQQEAPLADAVASPPNMPMLPREAPRSPQIIGLLAALEPFEAAALDLAALQAEDAGQGVGPLRIGVVQDMPEGASPGQWTQLGQDGWLWTTRIRAAGARGIRVCIPAQTLPADAELSVFAAADERNVRGPFRGAFMRALGDFWTPTVYADDLFIEYLLPAGHDHQAPENTPRIAALVNQYRGLEYAAAPLEEVGCHLDALCFAGAAGLRDGVGALSFVAGGTLPGAFFCSGAMLNRNPGDFTRLFMTATHCGVNAANANTVEVTWLWQSSACGGTRPDPNTLPQSLGATVLVRDVTTDWTLMGLNHGDPGGTVFEGWDSGSWSDGSSATSVSHPDGSFKRVAFGTKINNSGSRPNPAGGTACVSGSSFSIEFTSGNGLTEPGSSGSPIFDAAGRVRGTLSCGPPATCAVGASNFGRYGRLDQAFSLLSAYLAPVDPVFANLSFGGTEVGTVAQPFNTVIEGTFAVIAGSTLHVEAGSYPERILIEKAMIISPRNGSVTIGN